MISFAAKRLLRNSFSQQCATTGAPTSIFKCNYAKKKSTDELIFTLQPEQFTMHKFDAPDLNVQTSKEELLHFFYEMSVVRKMEVLADNMYKEKLIKGFLHLYNGQEAISSGIEAAIRKSDHIITAYRDHGFMYCRGGTVTEILGELLGKSSGCSRGKGGSMHMYSSKNNFHGGNGIVGAHVPVGTGLAYAEIYKGTDNLAIAAYGDGAANQGQVFESYNMAALWKLPMIFLCENNKFGMGTSIDRSSASTEHYTRGDFIPGMKIDGMNVLAVKKGIQHAAEYVRAGNGPLVLELETYRYVGHSMSDPGTTYRSREDVKKVRDERDPINYIKKFIIEQNVATEDELKALDKKAKEEVMNASSEAKASPDPGLDELYSHIFIEDTYARGVELPLSHYPQ